MHRAEIQEQCEPPAGCNQALLAALVLSDVAVSLAACKLLMSSPRLFPHHLMTSFHSHQPDVACRQALLANNNRPVLPAVSGAQKPFQHTKLLDDYAESHIMTAR